MPKFKYKAKNSVGGYINATTELASKADVIDEIVRAGLIPIEITEISGGDGSIVPKRIRNLFKPKVKTEQLVLFCRQMYSLSKAGIPMIRAITGLSDSIDHPALKESLIKINRDLIGGKSLAASMSEQQQIYPPIFIAMINVGENTGMLENIFAQLAAYFELGVHWLVSSA